MSTVCSKFYSSCPKRVHSRTIALQHRIYNLFYFIKDVKLLNCADDNTIATFSKSANDLITDLRRESENAIDWFRSNKMVVNPDKFVNYNHQAWKIKGVTIK